MLNVNTELLLILAGVTIAVLMQAGVLLGMFLVMRKAVQTANEAADEYRGKLAPLVENAGRLITTGNNLVTSAQAVIDHLRPHLESAATELENMTRDIRAQVNQLQNSVDEVAQKARHQVDRVDSMATSVLNGVDRFGTFLNDAVNVPIRQVNGVVAAARAIVDTLRSPAPARPRPRPVPHPSHVDDDKDLFV
jgi:ABC-type transporter Mla subunit MlaD